MPLFLFIPYYFTNFFYTPALAFARATAWGACPCSTKHSRPRFCNNNHPRPHFCDHPRPCFCKNNHRQAPHPSSSTSPTCCTPENMTQACISPVGTPPSPKHPNAPCGMFGVFGMSPHVCHMWKMRNATYMVAFLIFSYSPIHPI